MGSRFLLLTTTLQLCMAIVQLCDPCSCTRNYADCSQRINSQFSIDDLPDHISVINLRRNNISSLPVRSFNKNIKVLYLELNDFNEIPSGLCNVFPSLKSLNIARNQVRHLRHNDFEGCVQLESLNLESNKVTSIGTGALSPLVSLKSLVLSHNELVSINKNQSLFVNVNLLQTLDLSSNRIRTLETLSFDGLVSLDTLNLNRNGLAQLQSATFYHLSALKKLDLSQNSLTRLLNGTFFGLHNLTVLNVSHNNIDVFGGNLPLQFVQAIVSLDLCNNSISMVLPVGTAPRLSVINLSHNQITHIEDSAFANLVSLEKLDLAHNLLSSFEKSANIFASMPNLLHLNMSSNPIKNLPDGILMEISPKLQYLSLMDTSISTLSEEPLSHLFPSLQLLQLSTRNMYCDCNVAWLPKWLLSASFEATLDIRCAYPEVFRSQKLFDLRVPELQCSETSARPNVVSQPQTQSVLLNEDVSFMCVVKSGALIQMPRIEWTFKSKVIEPNSTEHAVIRTTEDHVAGATGSSEGTVVIMSSTLTLTKVTNSNEGPYQCAAHNEFGSDYSHIADLNVHVKPYFTLPPKNVTSRVNSTVELFCEAAGDPMPEIKFNKAHNGEFPAALEKRLQYVDVKYYILSVKPRDAGVYTCVAVNSAGNISRDFFINVLEIPTFEQKLSDVEREVGDNLVLPCVSRGIPKPTLVWQKDGKVIDQAALNKSRNGDPNQSYLMLVNELLVIRNIQFQDAGLYTCIIRNKIGTARDSARLRVLPVNGKRTDGSGSGGKGGSGDFNPFKNSSPLSVFIGVTIIIVVFCVVLTSLIWVSCLYCSKRKRNQTYSYDRSVDGGSFILRTGGSPSSNLALGTAVNKLDNASISCASNSVKDTAATYPYGGPNNLQFMAGAGTVNVSTNSIVPEFHHLQNCAFDNSRYSAGGGFTGRPANMFTSSSADRTEADRHFLSGPLITSTTSYEHFLSSNRHHSVTDGAIEHSGASFASLELSDAFIAGPANLPIVESSQNSSDQYPAAISAINQSYFSDTGGYRTGANLSAAARPTAEHSEHSTGASSEPGSSGRDTDNNMCQQHPSSRATRLPKVGSCDTPSYLRHYARFHDHNYQPNVNIMDLEDDAISVANSPAPLSSTSNLGGNITPGIPSTAITPTLPRFGSNIQGGPSLGDNNNGTRVSLSGGTAASGPSCSNNETDRICSNAINSHSFNHPIQTNGRTVKASNEASVSGGESSCDSSTFISSTLPQITENRLGFVTTGRIPGRRTNTDHGSRSQRLQSSSSFAQGRDYTSDLTPSTSLYHLQQQSSSSSSQNVPGCWKPNYARQTSACQPPSANKKQTPVPSHRSEHDLRSLAVQRDASTPPRRDPPRPPCSNRTPPPLEMTCSMSFTVNPENSLPPSQSSHTEDSHWDSDPHTSSSSPSQHNSNA